MQSSTSWRSVAALLILLLTESAAGQTADEVFGSWTLRCETRAADNGRECIMFQNLVLKTGGQPVLQFAIGLAPADAMPTVILSLPLGIALPPGVSIRIDEGKAAQFPVERCEPDGCRAGMKLRKATVAQLAEGRQLTITFFDGERQPIVVPLSLDGFSAGYAALAATRR